MHLGLPGRVAPARVHHVAVAAVEEDGAPGEGGRDRVVVEVTDVGGVRGLVLQRGRARERELLVLLRARRAVHADRAHELPAGL